MFRVSGVVTDSAENIGALTRARACVCSRSDRRRHSRALAQKSARRALAFNAIVSVLIGPILLGSSATIIGNTYVGEKVMRARDGGWSAPLCLKAWKAHELLLASESSLVKSRARCVLPDATVQMQRSALPRRSDVTSLRHRTQAWSAGCPFVQ